MDFATQRAGSKLPEDATANQASPSDGTPNEPIVQCCGNGVKAPKPRYTHEPEFTEAARYLKYQGVLVLEVVVDTAGTVGRVRTVRPLGMGLDEAAVESVKSWKFTPATLDGKPVAVRMNVEVSFSLN